MRKRTYGLFTPALLCAACLLVSAAASADQPYGAVTLPSPVASPAAAEVAGDWSVKVTCGDTAEVVTLDPQEIVTVTDEKYDSLPVFNPNGPPWRRAQPLYGVIAFECSVENAVVPGTIVVRDENGAEYVEGTDYQVDVPGGNVGRLEGGAIGEKTPVWISYQYTPMRIDSIVRKSDGAFAVVKGTPHSVMPVPPQMADGNTRLVNVYFCGLMDKLTDNNLFPILDDGKIIFPDEVMAERLLPKTWQKLTNGETVKVLAWGDSVTACGFIPDEDRWQAQFVRRLQARFPNAKIELVTEAWGGRNSDSYFAQPAGAEHNYQEKVLNQRPDLLISEFVNDGGFSPEKVEQNYGRIRDDLKNIGAEWIILTPHYIRPSWMGLSSQKNCDDDPRAYTQAIRAFGQKNNIAVADGSVLYGRLWRQGIPYITLMTNNINHPNAFGMSLFDDALMAVFGGDK
ncbi:MAG: hypothetical protein IJG25_00540 [Thermoguttaceae bacterium]|nr:hypothetical protein [Thermoguttaceae bacterium]